MKDLKIILEKVDYICEKFELEGLHTHPTYKQFKRLFTELNKIAEPVQLVSYATDMTTCTLTNGDGNGYFYNRIDPDQPATYTAVDMTTAAAQGFMDGAASKEKIIDALLNHCDDGECYTCGQIICPHGEPLHFHHDGCPSCAQDEPE